MPVTTPRPAESAGHPAAHPRDARRRSIRVSRSSKTSSPSRSSPRRACSRRGREEPLLDERPGDGEAKQQPEELRDPYAVLLVARASRPAQALHTSSPFLPRPRRPRRGRQNREAGGARSRQQLAAGIRAWAHLIGTGLILHGLGTRIHARPGSHRSSPGEPLRRPGGRDSRPPAHPRPATSPGLSRRGVRREHHGGQVSNLPARRQNHAPQDDAVLVLPERRHRRGVGRQALSDGELRGAPERAAALRSPTWSPICGPSRSPRDLRGAQGFPLSPRGEGRGVGHGIRSRAPPQGIILAQAISGLFWEGGGSCPILKYFAVRWLSSRSRRGVSGMHGS